MNLKQFFKIFICLFITTNNLPAQNYKLDVDAMISESYPKKGPGISILIAKNGKSIYTKNSGFANIELQVPINSKSIFEIGSITKQFTAIAILMLEEQGKLNVTDNITKYIPDYPTKGNVITIHNLLNHTSGIKNYTSMKSFLVLDRTDMTPTELINVFKNEPMDFKPGEKFKYNNSGYILLGHIIEVITKESYAEFVQKNIFSHLGMKSTFYGSMKKIIPNRASGYSKSNKDFVNANYLSLTLPYAAGSIMSTVDDLLIWQNALQTNKLIKNSSFKKATNGSTLNTGEKIIYGYGFRAGDLNGSPTIEHSGGIYGFSSNGIYLPKEDIYVIGLTNFDNSNIVNFVQQIAAIAINKPFYNKKNAIKLNESQLKKWTGSYQFDKNAIRYVTVKKGKIYSQREGSIQLEILPITEDKFMFEGSRTSYAFKKKNGKKEVVFTVDKKEYIGKEIDKLPPTEKIEITLSNKKLQQYIGSYKLRPGFIIDITVTGNKIFGVATGQSKLELFAYKENAFMLKVINADIIFNKNEQGRVISLSLIQNGTTSHGKKIINK